MELLVSKKEAYGKCQLPFYDLDSGGRQSWLQNGQNARLSTEKTGINQQISALRVTRSQGSQGSAKTHPEFTVHLACMFVNCGLNPENVEKVKGEHENLIQKGVITSAKMKHYSRKMFQMCL